ncbi:MAG: hypothetical protein Q7S09_00615, partial [bacterium]|nr:hypothetical protein [bacterium]
YLDRAGEMGIEGIVFFAILTVTLLTSIVKNSFSGDRGRTSFILSATFFVYMAWVLGYSFFDVVLFNDKVLILTTVLAALSYGHAFEKSEQPIAPV